MPNELGGDGPERDQDAVDNLRPAGYSEDDTATPADTDWQANTDDTDPTEEQSAGAPEQRAEIYEEGEPSEADLGPEQEIPTIESDFESTSSSDEPASSRTGDDDNTPDDSDAANGIGDSRDETMNVDAPDRSADGPQDLRDRSDDGREDQSGHGSVAEVDQNHTSQRSNREQRDHLPGSVESADSDKSDPPESYGAERSETPDENLDGRQDRSPGRSPDSSESLSEQAGDQLDTPTAPPDDAEPAEVDERETEPTVVDDSVDSGTNSPKDGGPGAEPTADPGSDDAAGGGGHEDDQDVPARNTNPDRPPEPLDIASFADPMGDLCEGVAEFREVPLPLAEILTGVSAALPFAAAAVSTLGKSEWRVLTAAQARNIWERWRGRG